MCLILIAVNKHPHYPLIIAANRDEFYARPSSPLRWWPENPQLLSGQDLESGGSWLGITRTGSLAAVTNYREAGTNLPQRPSRGILVSDYLMGKNSNWQGWLESNAQSFNGFNLLYGQWDRINWFSNRSGFSPLDTGIYGLCNSLLDTPWPKVLRGKQLFQKVLARQKFTEEDFLKVLQDHQLPADHELPDTGIGQEWERLLSPIFIRTETYGTRASTVLSINSNHQVRIIERNWQPDGTHSEQQVQFDITY